MGRGAQVLLAVAAATWLAGTASRPAPQAPTGRVAAPAVPAPWQALVEDHRAGRWESVLSALEQLEKASPESYGLRQADFLKATALGKLGRQADTMDLLETISTSSSPLAPLAAWRLFEAAQETRQPARALQYLERYRLADSPLVDADRADWEQALLLRHSSPERALQLLESLSTRSARYRRPALLQQSDLASDASRRHALHLRLIREAKTDDPAYEAARRLLAHTRDLSPADLVTLAEVLLANRDLEALERICREFLQRRPSAAQAPYFSFLLGRTWMLAGDWTRSVRQFEQTHARFPSSPWGVQSRYFEGHVHLRMRNPAAAAEIYQEVIDRYPDSEHVAGAFANLAETLRALGRPRDSARIALQGAERLGGGSAARLLYLAGKAVMAGSPAEALEHFRSALQAGRARQPDPSDASELHFWVGRCLEALGRPLEAAASYLRSAAEDTDYFSFAARDSMGRLAAEHAAVRAWSEAFLQEARRARADGRRTARRRALLDRYRSLAPEQAGEARRELLQELAADSAWARVDSLRPWPSSVIDDAVLEASSGSRQQHAAALLAALGFHAEAADILSRTPGLSDPLRRAFSCAVLYGAANRWGEALRQARLVAAGLPAPTPDLMPPGVAVFFLPLPFSATRQSDNVDPALVASVILRESLFQPAAKSPAGARGLMQLLPATARAVAADLGLPQPSLQDLYDPELSIRLGSAYLDRLMLQLEYPEMAVAAYNGGSDNVRRWAALGGGQDRALFVADIGFAETKNYVRRVLGNHRLYRILYGQQ